MSSLFISPMAVVTMDHERRVLRGGAVEVEGNRIVRVWTEGELQQTPPVREQIFNAPGLVMIPGFVQAHVHLCQTLFRGLADDLDLLDWLRLKIFPFEAAHTARSVYASAVAGIADLIRSGTTTILDMGTVRHEEEIIRAVTEKGIRAYVGKAMMDINDIHPPLQEPTREAIRSTLAFAEQCHRSAGERISYAVAPRFILSCTDTLLRDAYEITKSFPGMIFHTHAAENTRELDAVRKRCGMGNIAYFDTLNLLHENTCLAHCIWLDDNEMAMMAEHGTKVTHCPSSNLKLASGVARVPALRARGIQVALGADGAPCNNTLDMFQEMRLAALIQKPEHGASAMNAGSVFEMATRGGAAALGASDIGCIEAGKKADIVLLDLKEIWNPYIDPDPATVYSTIVYSGSPANVRSVMIDGAWVYLDGAHTLIDEVTAKAAAREELRLLLNRM